MKFRMLPPAVALATVLLLAGCVPSDPIITPEPEPDATPLFASDEEALAAATEAYEKYLAVADEIFHDGGNELTGLEDVATGELFKSTVSGFELAKEQGLRSTGRTTFEKPVLQRYDVGATAEIIVVIYVCEDLSAVDVLDASNTSVVTEDRPDRVLYEVSFDSSKDRKRLIASDRDVWSVEPC